MTPPATLDVLSNRLQETNRNIQRNGIVTVKKYPEPLLTGYHYHQFYDWDLYFENIYMLYNGVNRFCFSNVEAFFSLQKRNGFIPRAFGRYRWGRHHPFKPFMAQIVLLGCSSQNKYHFARRYFSNLEAYLSYYYKRFDSDRNDLCCWINADASGMDNQNSRVLKNGRGEGVDLNCYLYREYQAMTILAEKLNFQSKADQFRKKAEIIAQQVRDCLWDEETGFFYDKDERSGHLNKVKGISGFVPLWAGIATGEQARRLVKEHLLNPSEFATPYPIPTLSVDSFAYSQTGEQPPSRLCNWNGPAWVPMNYMVFHGLMNYGFADEAKTIAVKTAEMVLVCNHTTREYYNAVTGTGYGCNPFYGWSTLAYYMPLEYLLRYDPTQISDKSTVPLGKYFDVTL